jgi:hypothetical protein
MRKPWQPSRQECALIADMLAANRSKSAIARFLYVSESTLRRFLARVRARRHAAGVAGPSSAGGGFDKTPASL